MDKPWAIDGFSMAHGAACSWDSPRNGHRQSSRRFKGKGRSGAPERCTSSLAGPLLARARATPTGTSDRRHLGGEGGGDIARPATCRLRNGASRRGASRGFIVVDVLFYFPRSPFIVSK